MLNKIELKNFYIHKDRTIEFNEGLTRVSGANEAGKTLVFEAIRFALFGNSALRDGSASAKGATVVLTFTIAGKEYKVQRTTGNATLYQGDVLLARATKAVNNKIISLLGYGLKTFDSVNSVNQGDVEKLTKLSSPERKKFLDELIGIVEIDKLVADYKSELSIHIVDVQGYAKAMIDAPKPEERSGLKSEEIIKKIDEVDRRLGELTLQARIVDNLQRNLDKIVGVPDPMPTHSLEQLNELLDGLSVLTSERNSLTRQYPELLQLLGNGYTNIDIGLLRSVSAIVLRSNAATSPQLSKEQIIGARIKHDELANWNQVSSLRELLATYQSCPRCGLRFEKESAQTAARIETLLPVARPHRNLPSLEFLKEQEQAWTDYEKTQAELEGLDPVLVKQAKILGNRIDPNVNERLAQLIELNHKLDVNERDIHASVRAKQIAAQKTELEDNLRLEQNGLNSALEIELQEERAYWLVERHDAANYELALRYYEATQAKNQALQVQMAAAQAKVEELQKVVSALNGFKYYVNTYFLPAVSKAASSLLTTMTNGTRRSISISDKFEIKVGIDSVEVLSGSTKAVVNIALRLALQYVLTKNTFSVFLGDEIDGAFDKNRAKQLAECLTGMKDHVKQIIVISHRDIESTHEVKL